MAELPSVSEREHLKREIERQCREDEQLREDRDRLRRETDDLKRERERLRREIERVERGVGGGDAWASAKPHRRESAARRHGPPPGPTLALAMVSAWPTTRPHHDCGDPRGAVADGVTDCGGAMRRLANQYQVVPAGLSPISASEHEPTMWWTVRFAGR